MHFDLWCRFVFPRGITEAVGEIVSVSQLSIHKRNLLPASRVRRKSLEVKRFMGYEADDLCHIC